MLNTRKTGRRGGHFYFAGLLQALCALCLLGHAVDALAQGQQLSAEIHASSPPVRSSAPIVILWKLTPQGAGLLEGRFELTLFDEQQVVSRLTTDDVVISSGEQVYRTVLPSLESTNPFSQLDIRLVFIGKRATIDLGKHLLRVPGSLQRSFINCVCDPWGTSLSNERQQFIDKFRFEISSPLPDDRTVTTFPAHVAPDNMPGDPLGYCGFDIVLLMHEGLAELREKQLETLLHWVDAGGSLCVVPGNVLAPHHAAFLNKLVRAGPDQAPYVLDSAGRLLRGTVDDTGTATLRRTGLGRTAILHGSMAQFLGDRSLALRQAVAFLWKMRRDQSVSFVETGKWSLDRLNMERLKLPGQEGMSEEILRLRRKNLQLTTLPIQTGDQLLQTLMPQDIRVVPLNLIAVVLFLYVLLIGPADYFILGALKQRRLTWIVFPAVTVGVALLTVGMSNWYMTSAEDRHAVSFVDVGDGNKPARQSRFELLFTSRHRLVETEVRKAVFSPLNHQMFSQATWYTYQRSRGTGREFELVAPATYAGRLPVHYAVAQQMPQWTPQLNRLFTIAPEGAAAALDWDTLPVRQAFAGGANIPVWKESLRQALFKGFDSSVSAYVFTGSQVVHVCGAMNLFTQNGLQDVAVYQAGRTPRPVPVPPNGMLRDGQQSWGFLGDVCVQSDAGLFSVLSQLSPTGGRDFEDLALLDPSDPNQALLVVGVQRGSELVIYRKLYTGGE